MKLTPQGKIVLHHMRAHPYLTSWQAEGVYRIRRLASRIDELCALGYAIGRKYVKDATGQRYTRYFLMPNQLLTSDPILPTRAPKRREAYSTDQIAAAMERESFSLRDIEDVISALRGGAR